MQLLESCKLLQSCEPTIRWRWIVQGVIWFVKPIYNSILHRWLHGNVVDHTLLNKNKFMHPYTAFLQMILFFFSFKYIFCCQMLPYHWICSETVQVKWKKNDSHFRFWWQRSLFSYTALENNSYATGNSKPFFQFSDMWTTLILSHSSNLHDVYLTINQRWEGDCFYLGSWLCGN